MNFFVPDNACQRCQRDSSEDRILTEAAVTQKTHYHAEHHQAMPPLHRPRCAVGACGSHGAMRCAGLAF
jgi:hypothetical protein